VTGSPEHPKHYPAGRPRNWEDCGSGEVARRLAGIRLALRVTAPPCVAAVGRASV